MLDSPEFLPAPRDLRIEQDEETSLWRIIDDTTGLVALHPELGVPLEGIRTRERAETLMLRT